MKRLLLGTLLGAALTHHFVRMHRRITLAGRVVLITGGSRGLGLVLAREFVKRGAKVAIAARDRGELSRAIVEFEDGEALAVPCDLSIPEERETLISAVHDTFGPISILVNNAGIITAGPLQTARQEDFETQLQLHLWAPLDLIQRVIPDMEHLGEGRIANVSSLGGLVSVPHLTPYCTSKFALVGMSRGIAPELRKKNIFVTTVCPGLMRTGSHRNALFKGAPEAEQSLFSLLNATPGLSISAERAARRIIGAIEVGSPELILTLPARLLAALEGVCPSLLTEAFALTAPMLPEGTEDVARPGWQAPSPVSPSMLTYLADQASVRNNEF